MQRLHDAARPIISSPTSFLNQRAHFPHHLSFAAIQEQGRKTLRRNRAIRLDSQRASEVRGRKQSEDSANDFRLMCWSGERGHALSVSRQTRMRAAGINRPSSLPTPSARVARTRT